MLLRGSSSGVLARYAPRRTLAAAAAQSPEITGPKRELSRHSAFSLVLVRLTLSRLTRNHQSRPMGATPCVSTSSANASPVRECSPCGSETS